MAAFLLVFGLWGGEKKVVFVRTRPGSKWVEAQQDRRDGVGKHGMKSTTIRDLGILFTVGAVGGLSNVQLLGCFVERREEAAFEAIIHRQGRWSGVSAAGCYGTTTRLRGGIKGQAFR